MTFLAMDVAAHADEFRTDVSCPLLSRPDQTAAYPGSLHRLRHDQSGYFHPETRLDIISAEGVQAAADLALIILSDEK